MTVKGINPALFEQGLALLASFTFAQTSCGKKEKNNRLTKDFKIWYIKITNWYVPHDKSGGRKTNMERAHKINKKSKIPLYYQLMDIIIEKIENREFKPNDQLPSERALVETFAVSRATVRQAIRELEIEGYVYTEHGKGTFVSVEKYKQDLLQFYSFTEEMKKAGKEPSSRVLNFEIVNINKKLARKMNLTIDQKAYKVIRLRLADNEPMMLETSYLPYDRFPVLQQQELENKPMYDIFREKYTVTLNKAEETFQATSVRESEANYLQVESDSPGILLERYTYEGAKIIEYTVSVARGDKFKFHVTLEK